MTKAEQKAKDVYPQKGDNLISQKGYDLMRSIYVDGYEAGYDDALKEQKPAENTCGACCDDERFKIIAQAKKDIIEKTNIAENELSMELPLLDGILMRVWQVGWLNKKPAEWSEEDEEMLSWAVELVERYEGQCKLLNWLKSFRNRPKSSDTWKPSEENMNTIQDCIRYLSGEICPLDIFAKERIERSLVERLKSLKNRGNFPKWKPSEEQMEVLEKLIRFAHGGGLFYTQDFPIADSLYNDLKKLED